MLKINLYTFLEILAPFIATIVIAFLSNGCEDCGVKVGFLESKWIIDDLDHVKKDVILRLGLSVDNVLTLSLQLSLWSWSAYLVSTHFCQTEVRDNKRRVFFVKCDSRIQC